MSETSEPPSQRGSEGPTTYLSSTARMLAYGFRIITSAVSSILHTEAEILVSVLTIHPQNSPSLFQSNSRQTAMERGSSRSCEVKESPHDQRLPYLENGDERLVETNRKDGEILPAPVPLVPLSSVSPLRDGELFRDLACRCRSERRKRSGCRRRGVAASGGVQGLR